MERRAFDTPLGPIWLSGRASAFESDRPLVLGITGAFATPDGAPAAGPLGAYLAPETEVVTGHLPGNHCPPLASASVRDYAAAYSHAIGQAFAGRSILVLGASVGGLVALALRRPEIRAGLIVEPPLVMSKVWPLTTFLRETLAAARPGDPVRAFIVNVFGVSETAIEERDYRDLIAEAPFPVRVLVGDQPLLPRRAVTKLPSLVDGAERELIAAHPAMRLEVAPGAGHNVMEQAAAATLRPLLSMLHALKTAPAAGA